MRCALTRPFMHFTFLKGLAGAVLLALATLPVARAEVDFNTLEVPGEIASVLPYDGPSSTRQEVSTAEAGRDSSLGGAILNPFSQPADPPPPAPAVITRPPITPESHSDAIPALIVTIAGAALAGGLLRRRHALSRRSA